MRKNILRIGWLVTAAVLPFLFIDFPGDRLTQRTLDIGHIFYFGLIVTVVLRSVPALDKASVLLQLAVCAGAALVIGGGIEILQSFTSRSASIDDVRRDLEGAIAGVVLFSAHRARWSRRLRLLVWVGIAAILLLECRPALKQLKLVAAAELRFPVIADFEDPLDAKQWTRGHRSEQQARQGKAAMEVRLSSKERYSTTAADVLVGNWSGYKKLHLSIANMSSQSIEVWVQVLDDQNKHNHYAFDDRFDRAVTLAPGWNDIEIPLDDIIHAPRTRLLDITRVHQIAVYGANLDRDRIIFVDDIRLVR